MKILRVGLKSFISAIFLYMLDFGIVADCSLSIRTKLVNVDKVLLDLVGLYPAVLESIQA